MRLRTAVRRLLGVAAVLAVSAAGLAARAPIRPAAYEPPPAPPLSGPLAPGQELAAAERLGEGHVPGPETVVVDARGVLWTGTEDGRIVRLQAGGWVETAAATGGRPIGLRFAPDGRLVVADGKRGLLAVDERGTVEVLASGAGGRAFGLADDVEVARDGTLYVSDASRLGLDAYLLDGVEARPSGRLVRFDPARGEARVLAEGLWFANGLALSPGEDFILVNETYRYRVSRVWLRGARAGTRDVFADNLPGFPDGIAPDGRGGYWLALFTVRKPLLDVLHPHPLLKRLLAGMPKMLWPGPRPYGLVLQLDGQGRVLRSLHDPEGARVRQVTSVREHGGWLYLGSLPPADFVSRLRVP